MQGRIEIINTPLHSAIDKVLYIGPHYTKKNRILNIVNDDKIKMTTPQLTLENDEVSLYNIPIAETNVIAVKVDGRHYLLHDRFWDQVLKAKMVGDDITLSLQEDIIWDKRVMRANLKLIHVEAPMPKLSGYSYAQLEMACKMSMMMGAQNKMGDAAVQAWWNYRKPAILTFLDAMEKGTTEVKPDLTKQGAPTDAEGLE